MTGQDRTGHDITVLITTPYMCILIYIVTIYYFTIVLVIIDCTAESWRWTGMGCYLDSVCA